MTFICCRDLFFNAGNARKYMENKYIGKESDRAIRYTIIIKADAQLMSA